MRQEEDVAARFSEGRKAVSSPFPEAGRLRLDWPHAPITQALIVRPQGLLSVLLGQTLASPCLDGKRACAIAWHNTVGNTGTVPLLLHNWVEEEGWQKPPLEMQS